MPSIRRIILAAALVAGVAATADKALAFGSGNGPFSNGPKYPTIAAYLGIGKGPQLPVFQAAPWYLYWPYDGHFLTPAPIGGAFYPPPVAGNFPVNPYFPAPAAPYGPIPGGPAPVPPVGPAPR